MFRGGRGQGFGRGRGWSQEGQGLQQGSTRKRKWDALPEMFNKQVNIRHSYTADAEQAAQNCSQNNWHRSHGGNFYRGSGPSVCGFRNSQPNPHGWNAQETHGRRFLASERYSRTDREDKGNQRQETTSGEQGGDHRQKNYMQRHETRTGNSCKRNDLVYLSKTMSYLLRHGAMKAGLRMQSDGYVLVSDLLRCKVLQGPSFTEDDVRRVTNDNDKQRFQLKVDPVSQTLLVRANQGHTVEIPHLELESISDAREAPVVLHGTFLDIWPTIEQQGLSKMSRNHIHFSVGKPGDRGVISGMRGNCQVFIYINMRKALEDGIKFFRSANNVILSPGDEKGFISPQYFDHVEFRLTGKSEQKNGLDSKRLTNSSSERQTEESSDQWTNESKEKKKRK